MTTARPAKEPPGLVPTIHVFVAPKQWMAATSAAMTVQPPPLTLAQVSRRPTVRLNTGRPGAES